MLGYVRVRFENAIYVLHACQKSPAGTRTAALDAQLVAECLKRARQDYEATK